MRAMRVVVATLFRYAITLLLAFAMLAYAFVAVACFHAY